MGLRNVAVAGIPCRQVGHIIIAIAMLLIAPKMRSAASGSSGRSFVSNATAVLDSGTEYSTPAFIRLAGTVHIAAPKSTSPHCANHLAGAGRREDGELKCASGDCRAHPKLDQKRGRVRNWQRLVVPTG